MHDDSLSQEETIMLLIDEDDSSILMLLDEVGDGIEDVCIGVKTNSSLFCVVTAGDREQGTLAMGRKT